MQGFAKLILALALVSLVSSTSSEGGVYQAAVPRIAVVGLSGDTGPKAAEALEQTLATDDRLALVDNSLVKAAAAGIGYSGSINMSTFEARQLGAAIGCDFFIIGVAQAATRSVRSGESHAEAIIGVMLVDGRSGALVAFDFIAEIGPSPDDARAVAIKNLTSRVAGYVSRAMAHHASRTALISNPDAARGEEIIEDLPEPDSPRAQGFVPPEFISRVKPDYSEQADRADISATVEALVVFRADGQVGEIEIARWAAFGLDESAIRAIKQLKFKRATRDGKAVGVRAVVQYNFRKSPGEAVPTVRQPAPEEKKTPDLRDIFKPKYVRPGAGERW